MDLPAAKSRNFTSSTLQCPTYFEASNTLKCNISRTTKRNPVWNTGSWDSVLPREGIPPCFKISDSAEGKQQHEECLYYVLRTQYRSPLLSVYTAVTSEASGAICSAVSTSHIMYHISSGRPHFILPSISTYIVWYIIITLEKQCFCPTGTLPYNL